MLPTPRLMHLGRIATITVLLTLAGSGFAQTDGDGQNANPPAAPAQRAAYVPLTGRQRAVQYAKDLVNPIALVSSAASAGFGQWRDKPPEWGQGAEGLARRFGSAYATHITRQTLLFGGSSLLHEDNRYVRCTESGAKARLGYAIKNTLLARHDDGSQHVSISKIGAYAGAAYISRAWQPPDSHRLRTGTANFGISMGVAAGFTIAQEFLWPLFHRR